MFFFPHSKKKVRKHGGVSKNICVHTKPLKPTQNDVVDIPETYHCGMLSLSLSAAKTHPPDTHPELACFSSTLHLFSPCVHMTNAAFRQQQHRFLHFRFRVLLQLSLCCTVSCTSISSSAGSGRTESVKTNFPNSQVCGHHLSMYLNSKNYSRKILKKKYRLYVETKMDM